MTDPVFSEGWLAGLREALSTLPAAPGATARVEYVVAGAPHGTHTFHLVIEDGRVVEGGPGPDPTADFSMQFAAADYLDSLRGSFDPSVGFMQGRVKVVGNVGRLLSVLPITTSEPWLAAVAPFAGA